MNNRNVNRDDLAKHLATTLDINRFRDYCPNGLQVEGRRHIKHLVTGVTASLALLEAAHAAGADAVLVHHGYFWRGEDARVIGPQQRRLKLLLTQDINLFAYHLPLDAHPTMGNNAQLGERLGFFADGHFGEQDLGWLGKPAEVTQTVADLARLVEQVLGRAPCGTKRTGRCDCRRRQHLPQWRDFRADCASCARVRCGLSGLRSSRNGALRRAGAR